MICWGQGTQISAEQNTAQGRGKLLRVAKTPSCSHKDGVHSSRFLWMQSPPPHLCQWMHVGHRTGSWWPCQRKRYNPWQRVFILSIGFCVHTRSNESLRLQGLDGLMWTHECGQPVCFSTMRVLLLLAFNLTSPWTCCTSLIPGRVNLSLSLSLSLSDLPRLLATEEQMESVLWPRYICQNQDCEIGDMP